MSLAEQLTIHRESEERSEFELRNIFDTALQALAFLQILNIRVSSLENQLPPSLRFLATESLKQCEILQEHIKTIIETIHDDRVRQINLIDRKQSFPIDMYAKILGKSLFESISKESTNQ